MFTSGPRVTFCKRFQCDSNDGRGCRDGGLLELCRKLDTTAETTSPRRFDIHARQITSFTRIGRTAVSRSKYITNRYRLNTKCDSRIQRQSTIYRYFYLLVRVRSSRGRVHTAFAGKPEVEGKTTAANVVPPKSRLDTAGHVFHVEIISNNNTNNDD